MATQNKITMDRVQPKEHNFFITQLSQASVPWQEAPWQIIDARPTEHAGLIRIEVPGQRVPDRHWIFPPKLKHL